MAGLLITTEAMVTDRPEPKAGAMPHDHDHGMGEYSPTPPTRYGRTPQPPMKSADMLGARMTNFDCRSPDGGEHAAQRLTPYLNAL